MEGQAAGAVAQLMPMIIFTIAFGVTAHCLAKEKGRKVVLWTILGCIPVINFLLIWFFIGAANLKLERKVDELLANQKS